MKGFSKIILSLLLLTLSSSLFAQKKEVYISPNNDGIQDEFVLPIKISDKAKTNTTTSTNAKIRFIW